MPRVIQAIECEERRGRGTHEDPARIVLAYYTLDGQHLASAHDQFDPDREHLKQVAVDAIERAERAEKALAECKQTGATTMGVPCGRGDLAIYLQDKKD